MPSLVDKENNEELGRWARQIYLEAKAECDETARKLDQYSHERYTHEGYVKAMKARKNRDIAWGVIYVVTFIFIWWAK